MRRANSYMGIECSLQRIKDIVPWLETEQLQTVKSMLQALEAGEVQLAGEGGVRCKSCFRRGGGDRSAGMDEEEGADQCGILIYGCVLGGFIQFISSGVWNSSVNKH